MREEWGFEPGLIYLNHGTVGAPPRRVLAAQQAIRDEIERQPARFLLRELATMANGRSRGPSRLRRAIESVAPFVGAQAADLVFVDNATTGMNAVLRSFDFTPGDEILVTDLAYGAVTNTARRVAQERGALVRRIELPYPPDAEAFVAAVSEAIGPRTRLAIVDHVTSETALVLPLADIVARCRARGVAVAVDGAHAPGAFALD